MRARPTRLECCGLTTNSPAIKMSLRRLVPPRQFLKLFTMSKSRHGFQSSLTCNISASQAPSPRRIFPEHGFSQCGFRLCSKPIAAKSKTYLSACNEIQRSRCAIALFHTPINPLPRAGYLSWAVGLARPALDVASCMVARWSRPPPNALAS